MRTETFYKVFIMLLLFLNLGTLGYLWFNNNDKHEGPLPPHKADEVMMQKFGFDDNQREIFDGLRHEHHSQMVKLHQEAKELHVALFGLLKNKVVDTFMRDSLLKKLQVNSTNKEIVTFDHFQKLRAILRPDQQSAFDDFMEQFSRRIMSPKPQGGHN